jgi:GTP cyclohydrolase I/GTP cyclohydrolase-4
MAVEEFESFGDDAFVMSRQENLETIHQHNVVAERYGLVGELASELRDDVPAARHVTMREWLEADLRL